MNWCLIDDIWLPKFWINWCLILLINNGFIDLIDLTPEKEARIKCIEKENVCVEEARRESIKENEKKAVDMSQEVCTRSMVRNKKPEAERASQNQEYQENKRSEAEERTKDACSPQKQLFSLLSSCPPHQLTQPTADQSDAVLHNLPIETVKPLRQAN